MLLNNILGYLLLAFILAYFGFDTWILRIINDFFKTAFNTSAYYVGFLILALLDTYLW